MQGQETQAQLNIYGFMQKAVYFVVLLDCLEIFYLTANVPVLSQLLKSFAKIKFIFPPMNAKISEIVLIIIVAVGTKAKKQKDLNIVKSIVIPVIIGLLLMFGSLMFVEDTFDPTAPNFKFLNLYQIIYAALSFIGVMLTLTGADAISKIIKTNMAKDRFNIEEEAFDQNTERIDTETSVNIPYQFRYKKANHKGWININPFRGTLIIGTPGSGKSYGLINPSIRQLTKKGFSLCIYDYKFPDLAQIAYYHYLLKKKTDKNYNHDFFVINLDDVERSKRVNPFKKEYIQTLAQAQEMAEAMVSALQKGSSNSGGSEQFFTQSAVNFLASCIYFFAEYEGGKFSDLPHLLSFINKSYKEIFDTLFSHEELNSLLSPFKSAYDQGAFDQLEGQIGTLKIFISRLATKESFWVFSGDEVNLKISDKEKPTVMILASHPETQDINSALLAAVLNRTTTLINNKGNCPCAIIADEFPTIYIHKIDNIVATARSNKVAVMLGMQEIPQLKQFYKKEIADTIAAIIANTFSGQARNKETLDWLEKLFGKIKQKSESMSISQQGTTTTINEKMDFMIPAGKIAALQTGQIVGMVARDAADSQDDGEFKPSAVSGIITLNEAEIRKEEQNYPKMPTYYSFIDKNGTDRKNDVLITNFRRINKETDLIVQEFFIPEEPKENKKK